LQGEGLQQRDALQPKEGSQLIGGSELKEDAQLKDRFQQQHARMGTYPSMEGLLQAPNERGRVHYMSSQSSLQARNNPQLPPESNLQARNSPQLQQATAQHRNSPQLQQTALQPPRSSPQLNQQQQQQGPQRYDLGQQQQLGSQRQNLQLQELGFDRDSLQLDKRDSGQLLQQQFSQRESFQGQQTSLSRERFLLQQQPNLSRDSLQLQGLQTDSLQQQQRQAELRRESLQMQQRIGSQLDSMQELQPRRVAPNHFDRIGGSADSNRLLSGGGLRLSDFSAGILKDVMKLVNKQSAEFSSDTPSTRPEDAKERLDSYPKMQEDYPPVKREENDTKLETFTRDWNMQTLEKSEELKNLLRGNQNSTSSSTSSSMPRPYQHRTEFDQQRQDEGNQTFPSRYPLNEARPLDDRWDGTGQNRINDDRQNSSLAPINRSYDDQFDNKTWVNRTVEDSAQSFSISSFKHLGLSETARRPFINAPSLGPSVSTTSFEKQTTKELSATIDKIMQTIGFDPTLAKIMQDKVIKKENDKIAKLDSIALKQRQAQQEELDLENARQAKIKEEKKKEEEEEQRIRKETREQEERKWKAMKEEEERKWKELKEEQELVRKEMLAEEERIRKELHEKKLKDEREKAESESYVDTMSRKIFDNLEKLRRKQEESSGGLETGGVKQANMLKMVRSVVEGKADEDDDDLFADFNEDSLPNYETEKENTSKLVNDPTVEAPQKPFSSTQLVVTGGVLFKPLVLRDEYSRSLAAPLEGRQHLSQFLTSVPPTLDNPPHVQPSYGQDGPGTLGVSDGMSPAVAAPREIPIEMKTSSETRIIKGSAWDQSTEEFLRKLQQGPSQTSSSYDRHRASEEASAAARRYSAERDARSRDRDSFVKESRERLSCDKTPSERDVPSRDGSTRSSQDFPTRPVFNESKLAILGGSDTKVKSSVDEISRSTVTASVNKLSESNKKSDGKSSEDHSKLSNTPAMMIIKIEPQSPTKKETQEEKNAEKLQIESTKVSSVPSKLESPSRTGCSPSLTDTQLTSADVEPLTKNRDEMWSNICLLEKGM